VNHAQSIHSINFGLFILFHQLASSKLSYFAQTCQLARMASTLTEILAKIIWRAVVSHTAFIAITVFMETLKTCALVPILVVIFLSFLIRNLE
jgi:hypothetical protein